MIESTDAIVLKAIKYGDTSKIATLYTRRFGKMTVIAKGARSAKNKFGSALEPMSLIHAVLYRKENREIQLLSQADLLRIPHRLLSDERKLTAGLCLIEFMHATLHEEEEHPELFDAAREALEGIDGAGGREVEHLARFLFRLSALLGFAVGVHRCARCGITAPEGKAKGISFVFLSRSGLVYCDPCSPSHEGVHLSPDDLSAIAFMESGGSPEADEPELSPRTVRQVFHIAVGMLRSHIHGLRKIHTLPMIESILSDAASKTGEK